MRPASRAFQIVALFAAFGVAISSPGRARAEVTELQLAHGFGIGYLQFHVMQHGKLIEKQAASRSLGDIKTTWTGLSDGTVMNEGLLAGKLHVASAGIGAFLSLWSRGQGPLQVKGIAAMGSAPLYLNTRNPDVKSIKDFTDKDRIAIAGPLVSPQATTLQLASAMAYGDKEWARLDKLTVGMPNPTGMQALLAGTEVTAHFTTPPYTYLELEKPGIRRILNSYDVWGGKHTTFMAWTTEGFKTANPKLLEAVYAAMDEAARFIVGNKAEAADIYLAITKEKASRQEILQQLQDPEIDLTTTPRKTQKFAEFKFKIGAIKRKPDSWRDMFFAPAHMLDGD